MSTIGSGLAQEPPAPQPRFEVFGGYSVNTDYVKNRAALLIADEKVSPYFSHGSGPTGFEASFKHFVWNGLGIKGDLSSYSDAFPHGKATYCQSEGSATGVACGTGLTFAATGRAFYLTVGPEWKFRRDKRFAPFAEVLTGVVHARSRFEMAGSDVQYAGPFTGGVLLFTSAGFPKDRNVTYSDSHADTGLALSIGGGLDTRLSKRLSFRMALDYDPTFLVRPVVYDPTPDEQGRVLLTQAQRERNRQDHVRLSLGIAWRIR